MAKVQENVVALSWNVEKKLVKDLKIWSKNPRKISKQSFSKLIERIQQRGLHDVLKIDTENVILSGNQRKKALTQLGIKEVTVLVPNRVLTEDERNKVALESNINDGTWDLDELRSFDVGTLSDLNFDEGVLNDLWVENEVEDDSFDVEKELAEITEPKTKLGDLIIMGEHKLICGDSTDPKVLSRLFGEEKASMIYSDPIYNLKGGINYSTGIGGKKNYGGNVNDNRTDEEYQEFLRKSMVNAFSVAKDDIHVFYWSSQLYIWLIQVLYRELGIENKSVCLWAKNSQNPVPSIAFNRSYEPVIYGVRGRPYLAKNLKNLTEIMNKEVGTGNSSFDDLRDVWMVKRMNGKDMEHATSKPPELHKKAIMRCTKPGDIILDSFSGSASTMIAAEQLKRRVYAVELEPQFCDLAIKRYELLTAKKAEIISEYEEK